MRLTAVITLFAIALLLAYGQPSAQNCTPVPLVDSQIQVASWIGCQLNGTITTQSGSTSVNLFADSVGCPVASKVPGLLWVRYAPSNNNVAVLSSHTITDPMPPLCQTSGTVSIQGFVYTQQVGGVRVPNARVEVRQGSTVLQTKQTNSDGLFSFANVPVGSVLVASFAGLDFTPVTVTANPPPTGNYFLYGGVVVPSPSPTPTSTPTPSPAPECGKVAWPSTEAAQDKVLADQWLNRCRLKKNLSGAFAEFEKVP